VDQWLKPDFREIGVSGECTAYAGTQDGYQSNSFSAHPKANNPRSVEVPLPSEKRISYESEL
jgi:hypothetical protein